MKKTWIFFIFLLLVTTSVTVNALEIIPFLYKKKLEIIDINVQDYGFAGDHFPVNVIIKNNRIFSVIISVRVDLLNGALECIKKEIGNHTYRKLGPREELKLPIDCIVRKGDIDWYKEEYNVRAVLFREFDLLGRRIPVDESTTRGIHIKSPFSEKEKVKIKEVNVKDILNETEEEFNVIVKVSNEGFFNVSAWIRIDLVEKPAALPELEEYLDIKAFATERKELGNSSFKPIKSHCETRFVVHCSLRRCEIEKKRFNIEAVLFVNIDGMEYQVDTSTLYSIYHKQPICREEGCWFLGGIIIGVSAAVLFIAFLVYRKLRNPYSGLRKY